jgi:hypothetical protein
MSGTTKQMSDDRRRALGSRRLLAEAEKKERKLKYKSEKILITKLNQKILANASFNSHEKGNINRQSSVSET